MRITTWIFIALIIGLIAVNFFRPGDGLNIAHDIPTSVTDATCLVLSRELTA